MADDSTRAGALAAPITSPKPGPRVVNVGPTDMRSIAKLLLSAMRLEGVSAIAILDDGTIRVERKTSKEEKL